MRGVMLRLTRRRTASVALGLSLVAPAIWLEFFARDVAWWLQGLGLIGGATGLALVLAGLGGARPDWIE
jgi:hypothetical protein